MPHSGDGTGWDETLPLNTEPRKDGALEIRDLRKGARIRTAKEHITFAASSAGGEHKAGSAKAYDIAANPKPTLRPDGVTALDTNDAGRLLMFQDNSIWGWDGSVWVKIGDVNINQANVTRGTVVTDPVVNVWGSRVDIDVRCAILQVHLRPLGPFSAHDESITFYPPADSNVTVGLNVPGGLGSDDFELEIRNSLSPDSIDIRARRIDVSGVSQAYTFDWCAIGGV